jgi:hypothetical protein
LLHTGAALCRISAKAVFTSSNFSSEIGWVMQVVKINKIGRKTKKMTNETHRNTILLTERESAKRLSLAPSTLKRYRYEKKINFVRVGRRIAYRLSDLTNFIEKNAVEV